MNSESDPETPRLEVFASAQDLVDLERLCQQLFSAEELRRWVHERYPELGSKLPGAVVSNEELVHQLVRLLDRHGHVGIATEQLRKLRDARPRMRSPNGSERWAARSRFYLTCAAGVAAYWGATRAYPMLDVSRAMMNLERAVFGFVPPGYQRFALLALIGLMVVLSLVFWLRARVLKR